MPHINRRHFIEGLTAAVGAGLLNANAFEVGATFVSDGKNKFFDEAQMKLLARFVDIIIPDTDTPGASMASVHHYIDHMTGVWMTAEEKAVIVSLLDQLIANDFMSLDGKAQIDIIQSMDDERENNIPYATLKAYTVTGYYTSEIGASEELNYDTIPGPYHEILLKNGDRIWS